MFKRYFKWKIHKQNVKILQEEKWSVCCETRYQGVIFDSITKTQLIYVWATHAIA